MTHPKPTQAEEEELDKTREKLAAIEHERWADWQKWCHQVMREQIPVDVMRFSVEPVLERWERQIATPYSELTDKEKASDLEQVDRYWPLILSLKSTWQAEVRREMLEKLPEKRRGHTADT